MEEAKGAVLSLLMDAYQKRDKVALSLFAANRPKSVGTHGECGAGLPEAGGAAHGGKDSPCVGT